MTTSKWKARFDQLALRFGTSLRANDYDDTRMYRKIRTVISALLSKYQPKIMIDVGCGNGTLAHEVRHSSAVFGADFSWNMVNLATGRGIKCVQADALALPFRSQTADVALCIGMLQYIEKDDDLYMLLKELRRVVRPQGMILVSTLNAESFVRKAYALLHKNTEGMNFARMYHWEKLVRTCEELDVQTVNTLYFYTPFPLVTTDSRPNALSRVLSSSFLIVGQNK